MPGRPPWVDKAVLRRVPDFGNHDYDETHYYRTVKHPFVKSKLYGPDVQRFTMPLPEHYPRLAGKAANAFRMQLIQHEARLRKEARTQIPMHAEGAESDDEGEEKKSRRGDGGYGRKKTLQEKHHELMEAFAAPRCRQPAQQENILRDAQKLPSPAACHATTLSKSRV